MEKPDVPGWYLCNYNAFEEVKYWDGKLLAPYRTDLPLSEEECYSGDELKDFSNFRRMVEVTSEEEREVEAAMMKKQLEDYWAAKKSIRYEVVGSDFTESLKGK